MHTAEHILIIDEVHHNLLDKLEGHHVEYVPDIFIDELEEKLQYCTILIMRTKLRFTKEWIAKAPQLKVIGRLGSGMDNIDVDFAEQRGVICLNAPEGNRNAVAEQTIGMLLSLLANIHRGSREVAQRIWDRKRNSGIELESLTVGIIGYGNVGSQLARRLMGFGCTVVAYDLYKKGFGTKEIREVDLEELQRVSDVVSIHVPLNETSFQMIDKAFISGMHKPFYLLNLARGKVIKTLDVVEGLQNKKILGLALDVFENENLSELSPEQEDLFSYLSDNERVIMTPHIGGLTSDSFRKLAEVLWQKINSVLND